MQTTLAIDCISNRVRFPKLAANEGVGCWQEVVSTNTDNRLMFLLTFPEAQLPWQGFGEKKNDVKSGFHRSRIDSGTQLKYK